MKISLQGYWKCYLCRSSFISLLAKILSGAHIALDEVYAIFVSLVREFSQELLYHKISITLFVPWMTSLFFIHVILEVVWCELEVLEILLHPRLLNLVHFVYRRRNIEKPRFFKLFSITVVFKKAFCVWDLCWYLFEYIMHNGWVLHDAFIYWSIYLFQERFLLLFILFLKRD